MAKKERDNDTMVNTEIKHNFLYYAMPWNLKKEIETYGYNFTIKNMLFVYFIIMSISVFAGKMFKLPTIWLIPLLIASLFFAPKLVRNSYKNRYELQRFSDVNVYVEQMLYAFKNTQKILTSLNDVKILFNKGAMRDVIDNACTVISSPSRGKKNEDIEETALNVIATRYPNQYLKDLHRFMLKVENIGGNFDSSIKLLLRSRAMWENRIYKLQDKRRTKRHEVLLSCIMSVGLCIAMLYILPANVDISKVTAVRISNLITIIFAIRVYVKADSKLAMNLIMPDKPKSEKSIISAYHTYVNYDPKKGMIHSIFYSIVPAIILAFSFLIKNNTISKIVMVVSILLLFVTMCQHMIGHSLLGKRLHKEIGKAFPVWLMELALLLQTDNVQVAIFKTVDTALPVLRPELEKFRDNLTANPASSAPFLDFFADFNMPEITTSMQMLYSLSIGSGGDSEAQIENIIERNNIILDRAEEQANEDALSSMYLLFLSPVLLGGVSLMVDMTFFLLAFMQSMNVGL